MSAPVNPGDVLAGKYRVERVLGAGGMGVVVVATHIHLEQRVALKFLLPEALANADAVARFAREAKAAAKITSEHVAKVLDVSTMESGAPYMVMEFLDGGDLGQVLSKRGPLPIEEAIEYVLQALEAIAEAHAAGIVHRDLKPANLFLSRRADGSPTVKVLDFGISKLATKSADGATDPSMTKTSALMGSPLYMSPEQMRASKKVDARSDIWALGIILHELLTGASPFIADTMPELVATILAEPPPLLTTIRQDAPRGLEAVIVRCLEKQPEARYQNVAELAVALAEFAPARAQVSVERIVRVIQAAFGQVASQAGAAPALNQPLPMRDPYASGPTFGMTPSNPNVAQPQPLATTPMSQPGAGTMASWGATGGAPAAKKSNGGMIAAIVGGAIVVFGGIGLVVFLTTGRGSGNNTSAASGATSAPIAATIQTAAIATTASAATTSTPADPAPTASAQPSAPASAAASANAIAAATNAPAATTAAAAIATAAPPSTAKAGPTSHGGRR